MALNSPIADMLTRIRNANQAKKQTVSMPSSKLKVSIAELLKTEGFIKDYKVMGDVKKVLSIQLKYKRSTRVISGIRTISKPGLRVYAAAEKLPKVLNGLGVAVISTSKGIMTSKVAREKSLGGEVIAYVW